MMPMSAAENPASIIPIIIKDAVEFNLDEKKTMTNNAEIAPIKDARQMSHELFIQPSTPKTDERKITNATPNPDAEVIPSTEGSANGFLKSSCKSKPLTGKAIPANIAAKALGKR